MIVIFALAQLADGVSAVVAVLSRPAFRELNALPGYLLVRPEWALLVKIAGIIFIVALASIIARRDSPGHKGAAMPRLATGLLGLGIVAGAIGFASNAAVLVGGRT